MASRCSWKNLQFIEQKRKYKALDHNKPCKGFDTETKNGYALIIADELGWREVTSAYDAINFLCSGKNDETFNLFWNINFDFAAIFKWDRDVLEQFMTSTYAELDEYKITFLPRKCFSIHDRCMKKTYRFYDMWQFYHDRLGNASKIYLNENEHQFKGERAHLFDLHPTDEIGKYCQDDASKAARLGQRMVNGFSDQGLYLRHLYSTGYVAQEYSLRYADIPILNNLPRDVARSYWEAYRGGWFDIYKRGVVKATSYDLSSAYPAAMSKLYDIRDGHWEPELDETAAMGVLQANVTCEMNTCQPLAFQLHKLNVYPNFNRRKQMYMTFSEYFAYKDYMDIDVIKAWGFYPNEDAIHPYREIIDKLYRIKNNSVKNSSDYMIAKLIMNSLYGKTCQLTKRREPHPRMKYVIGKLFNPCYAAEITAWTRVQLFNAIYPYREKLVTVLTDGVIFDEDVTLKTGHGLGAFERKHHNEECLMLQTGVYQYKDGESATRGFGKNTDLWKACNTESPKIVVTTHRPKSFKECLIQDTYEDIGVFKDVNKDLNIGGDIKRMWPETRSACQLLDGVQTSVPVPVTLLDEFYLQALRIRRAKKSL